jgi:hypothetical protein
VVVLAMAGQSGLKKGREAASMNAWTAFQVRDINGAAESLPPAAMAQPLKPKRGH